jgi:hypothetical protein
MNSFVFSLCTPPNKINLDSAINFEKEDGLYNKGYGKV